MPDPAAVQSMFGRIAVRYDVANRILSGGLDVWWRRRLVATVSSGNPRHVLDLATGSGDVAFALARGLQPASQIVGMDFCQPMLDQAEAKKSAARGRYPNVTFRPGDGLALPLPDAGFDAVTISFGLRNLADRARGLREMLRVLRPGGQVVVLEFSQPHPWFRPLYYFYLNHVLPRVAGWMTGDRAAYLYLNESITQFPNRAGIAAEMTAAGFTEVQAVPLTFGTVALHSGRKPAP